MTDIYRITGTIYRLVGYGDIGYYRDLATAERNIRASGDEYETVTLIVRGRRIFDANGRADEVVGDVVTEADVPAKDRWQIA